MNMCKFILNTRKFVTEKPRNNNSNYSQNTQRKKCPYSELFWSAFSRIQSKCGKIRTGITSNTGTFCAVIVKTTSTNIFHNLYYRY